MPRSSLLLIGGRSGVGKSTVALALHDRLARRDVRHAVIEGDALDLAHPSPAGHGLAARNLGVLWSHYRELGYRRLIYTNTVSVLETEALSEAMGDDPEITSVLLQASDTTAQERLSRRERGESLAAHLERSGRRAVQLEEQAAAAVHRISTDGRAPRRSRRSSRTCWPGADHARTGSRGPAPGLVPGPGGKAPYAREMTLWHSALLARLESRLPGAVTPYGSITAPETVDGWSDLDVEVRLEEPIALEDLLGAPVWAFQESVDGDRQVVRAVLEDGRRVDLTFHGARARLPEGACDNAIRFDAALAAARFGRGSDLIGLHPTLGILREALIGPMLAADRAAETAHHRTVTPHDRFAAESLSLLEEPLGPGTALAAYRLHCAWRPRGVQDAAPSPGALEALIRRGAGEGGAIATS